MVRRKPAQRDGEWTIEVLVKGLVTHTMSVNFLTQADAQACADGLAAAAASAGKS